MFNSILFLGNLGTGEIIIFLIILIIISVIPIWAILTIISQRTKIKMLERMLEERKTEKN